MKSFRHRRALNLTTCLLATIGTWWFVTTQFRSPRQASYASGYLLGAVVIVLTSLHWRKRLTVIPLGYVSIWTQFHIYLGLYGLPIYFLHSGLHWPDGRLEQLLAFLFLSTSGSGVVGLYITRSYPGRLTRTGEQFIFEQIPESRLALAQKSRNLVVQSAAQCGTSTLADYYADHLSAYFSHPRRLFQRIIPRPQSRRLALRGLAGLERSLTAEERETSRELFHLLRKKDELEYQYALQLILKTWLFAHLALTYGTIIVGTLHGVVVIAFRGGHG